MLEGFDKGASTFAADVDRAFWITTGISAAMFLLVAGLMLFFIVRYHHSRVKPDEIRNIKNSPALEIAWTVIPTLLLFVVFYYGYTAFREIRTMPEDAFTVEVLGKRWSWSFTYPNGKRTDELYVPADTNIRLNLIAPESDVLHSFYVPAFRVKEDVVPGRRNRLWFKATVPGRYDIECAEYCGVGHSRMLSKVEVMEPAAFEAWYESDRSGPHDTGAPKDEGQILYKSLGCSSCHSLDGSVLVGPSFKGLFGSTETVVADGKEREVTVDEAYITNSILHPDDDIVKGFRPGLMPDLSGQIDEKQMQSLIGFIKAQKSPESETAEKEPTGPADETPGEKQATKPALKPEAQPAPQEGAVLFKSKGCAGCHSLDGTKKTGPSLKGVYGSTHNVVTNGKVREVTVDEAYLRNAIQNPNDDIVEGFKPGLMPPFGTILKQEEIDALVEYLKEVP